MKTRVLFVCMGNICRSPTAEGVFQKLIDDERLSHAYEVDSAGTLGYHAGAPPDPRSCKAASRRGIDLSVQRARRVSSQDFESFDVILAMDRANLEELLERCPEEHHRKVRLFLGGLPTDEVPDPYYGSGDGFERVLDLVEEGARRLLEETRPR